MEGDWVVACDLYCILGSLAFMAFIIFLHCKLVFDLCHSANELRSGEVLFKERGIRGQYTFPGKRGRLEKRG